MKVTLNVARSTGEVKEITLKKPVTVLGRGSECDLRIPIESCSRQHCEVRLENDRVFVKDLDSSNGTYINNEKIAEAEVEPGDALTIGPVVIRFRINGDPEELPPLPPTTVSGIEGVADEDDEEYLVVEDDEDVSETAPSSREDTDEEEQVIIEEVEEEEEEEEDDDDDDDDPLAALAGGKGDDEDDDPLAALAGGSSGGSGDALDALASASKKEDDEDSLDALADLQSDDEEEED